MLSSIIPVSHSSKHLKEIVVILSTTILFSVISNLYTVQWASESYYLKQSTTSKEDAVNDINNNENDRAVGYTHDSESLSSLYTIPYMDSEEEQYHIAKIHSLSNSTKASRPNKKSVIAMSLYGTDPKYVEGAKENAKLLETYFPGWTLRVYVAPSYATETIQELRDLGAEVALPPPFLSNDTYGMFWRFLPADDPDVERFISRDSDARLNARDRFAVQEWIESGKGSHTIRDHPNHYLNMNGGLWGSTHGVFKNETMLKIIEGFVEDRGCNSKNNWGCDNDFIQKKIWPVIEDDQMGHDSFFCMRRKNSVGFPTPRSSNNQFIGQTFMANNAPRAKEMKKLRRIPLAPECDRQKNSTDANTIAT